jgi:hypothetical protein
MSKSNVAGVKDEKGKVLFEKAEIEERWRSYTEKLYTKDPTITASFTCRQGWEKEPPILAQEIRYAFQSLAPRKSAVIDRIPIEMLQLEDDDKVVEVLRKLCQQVWDTMEWPEEWKTSLFVPIPKNGDPRDCGNNQTIALIPHCSKIMLRVLQKRISRYQAGFQRKKVQEITSAI